jgi:hypothetical protein
LSVAGEVSLVVEAEIHQKGERFVVVLHITIWKSLKV